MNKIQKYSYLQMDNYNGLQNEIASISKNLVDCDSDIAELLKLQQEKHRETRIAMGKIVDVQTNLAELNKSFMNDLLAAEKQNYTKTPEVKKKIVINNSELQNLHKNLDELKRQLAAF